MSELRVVVVPARVSVPERSQAQASIEQVVPREPGPTPPVSHVPPPSRTADAIAPAAKPASKVIPKANGRPKARPEAEVTAKATPKANVATRASGAKAALRADGSSDAARESISAPAVIALEQSDKPSLVVPPAASVPMPVTAAAASASSPQTVLLEPRQVGREGQERIDTQTRDQVVELAKPDRSELEAQRQAEQLELARVEAARLEAERQEAARRATAQQEAARQDAARKEAERQEVALKEAERQGAAREEAERQDAARREGESQEAARKEAERQDAARRDAERQDAARKEAERQDAARRDADRQDAARQLPARQAAAPVQAAPEETRREAALREIGRQLNEEAARREAASNARRLPTALGCSPDAPRRGRLFGRTDSNAELTFYAEAWARKIQLNMTFDMVREAAKRSHTAPLVTVAIRCDGSIESVTFVTSSGVREIDEAIRRIVQSQAPYETFQPALAREFDVIEVRRTWSFDGAVRLY